MFVKRAGKVTLVENYEEAKKVEADLDSIITHTLEPKLKHTTSKRPLVLTNPKEEHSNDLENVVKMMHNFSNKVVHLENDKRVSSYRDPFNPYYKKRKRMNIPNHMYLILLF